MGKTKTQRNYSIDILRIVAMLLIVAGHYIYWGINNNPSMGANAYAPSSLIDWSLLEIMRLVSTVAVDLYVFITGYFLIQRTDFRWKGFIQVWTQTLFYSTFIYVVLVCANMRAMDIKELAKCFFPMTFAPYWFVQKYLGLVLIAPFLSKLAGALNKTEYQIMLLIMLVLFISIPGREPFSSGTVCSLSWFIFLYLTAGYYRLHGAPAIFEKNSFLISITILGAFLIATFAMNYLQFGLQVDSYRYYSTGADSLLFFLSVPIFICFAKQKWNGKIAQTVAKIAPYTFGVYLIHEFRPLANIIWGDIMPNTVFLQHVQVLHCIVFSIALFLICILIDFVRSKTVHLIQHTIKKN